MSDAQEDSILQRSEILERTIHHCSMPTPTPRLQHLFAPQACLRTIFTWFAATGSDNVTK